MARFDIDTPQVSPDLDSPVFQEEVAGQDDTPDVNVFSDIGLGALRGIRGMAQSTYELVDYVGEKVTGGVIDLHDFEADWDWGLGESQTWQGQITEGVTQFLVGFIPMFGALSAASKAGALGKAGQVLSKSNFLRGMVAGAGADFTVFSANEHRLSNLIKQHTELRSPILDYLESDGDEGELQGRFKNALEGAILGAGAEAVIRGLMKGVQFIKAARKVRAGVDEPEQMIPELLRRPDADELLDEDAFIGPIRELDSLDSQARNAIGDGARKVIDDEAEAVIDSAEDVAQAQKDVEDYIEVSKERKETKFSDEVDPNEVKADAEDLVKKGIMKGGSVKLSTTKDKYGLLEEVNDLVDKREALNPAKETGVEHLETAKQILPDELDREYTKHMIVEDIETLTSIRNRITAFRIIAEDIVGEMNKAIENLATVGKEKTYAIVAKYIDDLYEYSALESQVARQFGKGLQQTNLFRNRKSIINVGEVRSGSDAGAKAAIRGRDEGMVDEVVALLTSGADTDTVLKQVLNIAEKSKGGRFEVLREVLLANLLSAPPSQFVNGFGGLLTLGLDTAEKSIGALFTGNPQLAKMHIMQTIDAITTAEVWKAAGRSYKTGSPTLLGDTATTPYGEVIKRSKLTSENLFGKPAPGSKHQSFNETMDKIFTIFKLPFRGLTGTDEIFKQINARRAAMFKATIEAMEQGIKDPTAIGKYVDDKLRSVVMAGGQLYSKEALYRQGVKIAKARGFTKMADLDRVAKAHVVKNYDKDRSAFAAYVGNDANVLSFTNDINPDSLAGGIYQLANKHPITSLVMPFIKTPLNILIYAKDRSVFEAMNGSRLYQQLTSSDTAVKSAAMGRLSTTIAASVGMLGVMRQFNRNENMHISGGGPRDPDKRKRLEETGWQPYSIKIGDKYYSYQRLDPFATIIGIYADTLDLQQEGEFNVSEEGIQKALITLFSVIQRNIVNKSYLTGVEQFSAALSDTTGTKIQRWIGSTSSNLFIPWSAFMRTTVGGVTGQIMDDHEVKMVRNMGDYWLRNIPVAQGRLDPKRNLLGEAQEYGVGNLYRAFMPINVREYDDSDDVMQEIARLSHGFTQVSPSYRGLIDLTNYRNSKNQSAHDRRLELMSTIRINGKSLRQSLQNVITSQEYQKHSTRSEPGLTSPRVRMLNRVLSEYRAKALDEMLKEFPELADFKRDYDLAKDEQRRGVAIDNLIQTLNF